jgi:hypothetical protein
MTPGATGAWEPAIGAHAVSVPSTWRQCGDGHIAKTGTPRSRRAPSGAIVIPGQAGMRENIARFASPMSLRGGVAVTAQWRSIARPPRTPRRRVSASPDHSDDHLPLPPDSTASQTTRRRFAAIRTAVAVEEPIA